MAQPPGSDTRARPHRASERPEDEDRGPHLADQIVGGGNRRDVFGRQFDYMPAGRDCFVGGDGDTMLDEQVRHGRDVRQIWSILQDQSFLRQHAGGHQRQCRILGAPDRNYAVERHTTLDPDPVHRFVLRAADRIARRRPIGGPGSTRRGCFYWSGVRLSRRGLAVPSGPLRLHNLLFVRARRCCLRRRRLSRNAFAKRSSCAARSARFAGVSSGSSFILQCNESATNPSRGNPLRGPPPR